MFREATSCIYSDLFYFEYLVRGLMRHLELGKGREDLGVFVYTWVLIKKEVIIEIYLRPTFNLYVQNAVASFQLIFYC